VQVVFSLSRRRFSSAPIGRLRRNRPIGNRFVKDRAVDLQEIRTVASPDPGGSRSRRQCVPTAIKRIPELQTKRKGLDHHVKAFAVTYSGSIE
jgi:hypothetical protein